MPISRPRLFVVDDEEALADIVSLSLEHGGFDARPFYCASSALRYARTEEAPDVVITDVSLPGMNGVSLAGELVKINPQCKIIFFTGNASDLDKLAQENEPGLQYEVLLKPITIVELVQRISCVVKKEGLSVA
jgi:DNA-binding response OmpR family regulator